MQAGPDWPCRLPSCYPPVPPALLNPPCAALLTPPLTTPLSQDMPVPRPPPPPSESRPSSESRSRFDQAVLSRRWRRGARAGKEQARARAGPARRSVARPPRLH